MIRSSLGTGSTQSTRLQNANLEVLFPLLVLQGGKRVSFPELIQATQIYDPGIIPWVPNTAVLYISPPREATHPYKHPGCNDQVIHKFYQVHSIDNTFASTTSKFCLVDTKQLKLDYDGR